MVQDRSSVTRCTTACITTGCKRGDARGGEEVSRREALAFQKGGEEEEEKKEGEWVHFLPRLSPSRGGTRAYIVALYAADNENDEDDEDDEDERDAQNARSMRSPSRDTICKRAAMSACCTCASHDAYAPPSCFVLFFSSSSSFSCAPFVFGVREAMACGSGSAWVVRSLCEVPALVVRCGEKVEEDGASSERSGRKVVVAFSSLASGFPFIAIRMRATDARLSGEAADEESCGVEASSSSSSLDGFAMAFSSMVGEDVTEGFGGQRRGGRRGDGVEDGPSNPLHTSHRRTSSSRCGSLPQKVLGCCRINVSNACKTRVPRRGTTGTMSPQAPDGVT